MKKSYDYFKTLKDLAISLSKSYESYNDCKQVQKEYFCFSALRNELSENLINEFVAPIERNDIFKLSFCLNEEFECIINLCEFLNLSDNADFGFLRQIDNLFHKQTKMFDFKNMFKSPPNAMKSVFSYVAECERMKKIMFVEIREEIFSRNQLLLNYVIVSAAVDVVNSVKRTFSEIGRVLINNS